MSMSLSFDFIEGEMETLPFLVLLVLIMLVTGEFVHIVDGQIAECNEPDREALVDFKNGLKDPEDRLSNSWRGSNCCQWIGIECDNSTGAVTGVDLNSVGPTNWSLSGEIRPSLAKLKSLRRLDLSFNRFNGIPIPDFFGSFEKLVYLYIDNSGFGGTIPPALSKLGNLVDLRMDSNLLHGPIPDSLGALKRLTTLSINENRLNGTLPSSLGQLSELIYLDVSSNLLSGTLSESFFANLTKMRMLKLYSNSFVFNVSSNWVPPFQALWLRLGSCQLGPSFPAWLKSQSGISELDISNASISDSIPTWFWNISNGLVLLNLSFNQLQGQLPNPLNISYFAEVDFSFNLLKGPVPRPAKYIQLLNLSNNKFSGTIPSNIGEIMSGLFFLSLARNQIVGTIPSSLGELKQVRVIDFSWNNLSGTIPASIGNCSRLEVLDLQENNLSGMIPESLSGRLLKTLHLGNNMISGEVPLSFQDLLYLETLDVGNNRLTGKISKWGQFNLPNLRILILRSNAFSGEIPPALMKLPSLQVLDLAENELSGKIPANFGSLQAMTKEKYTNQPLLYGRSFGVYYQENAVVINKGQALTYTSILSLLTCIDLSGNDLHGELPPELTKLKGLMVLNLSRNHITGQIPQNISELSQLSSLDLSSNLLSGPIPPTMPSLTFLSHLNLSDNNLSGIIPYSGQMTTFDASSFGDNPGLCGAPLDVNCAAGDDFPDGSYGDDNTDHNWFYMLIGFGYAAGMLVPLFILSMNRPWNKRYFTLVDYAANRLLYLAHKIVTFFRNHN